MSTPRQRGLVDELYALEQAAARWGDQQTIDDVHALEQAVKDEWFPIISGPINTAKAEAFGDRIAAATGTNPLDVDDGTPWAGVGSAQQNAYVGGDIAANVAAASDDVATSAGELAETAAKAASTAAASAAAAAKWIVGVGLVLIAAYLVFGRR